MSNSNKSQFQSRSRIDTSSQNYTQGLDNLAKHQAQPQMFRYIIFIHKYIIKLEHNQDMTDTK